MATASKSRAAKTGEEAAENVGDDIKALREDVDKLLGDIGKLARHETKIGVDAAKAGTDYAVQRGEAAFEQSRDYVRDNPLIACGAALGVGFVAALLLKR